MVAIFIMIPFIPALSNGFSKVNQIQLKDSRIISSQYSDLIIKTKNVSYNFFSTVNPIDIGYLNFTRAFKVRIGYGVIKNICFSLIDSSHNYVAINVNFEIYSNGSVFMQYYIIYSMKLHEITWKLHNIYEYN